MGLVDEREELRRPDALRLEAADPAGRVPESFGLKTMPTSYLIDRSGVVRLVHPGFRQSDVEMLRGQIKTLVEAKK